MNTKGLTTEELVNLQIAYNHLAKHCKDKGYKEHEYYEDRVIELGRIINE